MVNNKARIQYFDENNSNNNKKNNDSAKWSSKNDINKNDINNTDNNNAKHHKIIIITIPISIKHKEANNHGASNNDCHATHWY